MRIRIAAAVLLILVGVGAVAFTLFPPGSGSTSSTKYITAAATREDVVKSVVATGTVGPVATYSLAFGSLPAVSSSGSSSSSSGSGSSTVTWNVLTVSATIGQAVKKGDVLATADPADATLALTITKATLASAEAKLTSDQAGLNATDKAVAQLSVTQAQASLSQAQTAQSQTTASNNLKLSQQQAAVATAQAKLASDTAAAAVQAVLDSDQAQIASAQSTLASLQLQITQSNTQAANSVRSAQLQVQSAQLGYTTKTAPATATQIASDQAAVATAQQNVDAAQAKVDNATLTSPADGVILAVNITPGVDAPSGAAITIQSASFQVAASVTESDLPSLKVGQAVDVTITATKQTATGKLVSISPAGTGGTGGGVVSFPIVVSLSTPPAGTASGMSASISVTIDSATAVIAVPSTALVSSNGGYAVRTLDASGQPQVIPVTVGLVTTSLAEIKSGVAEGEAVVTGTASNRNSTTTTGGGLGIGGAGGFPTGGGTITRGIGN